MLLALSILWGGSFFFSKIALFETLPLTLVLYRVSIAALALFVFLKLTGLSLPGGRSAWLAFFGMGLLNNAIPFSLLFWGQAQISASLASILNATTPIFTIIVAHFLTSSERINPQRFAGIMLGFAGIVVMLGFDIGADTKPLAMLACLGAALSYGFAAVFGKRFAQMQVEPLQVAFGQLTASSCIMLVVVWVSEPLVSPWSFQSSTLWAILTLALACTAIAYILFFRILAAGGATNISLVTLLVPVSAIILGSVFLNESLTSGQYVGMLLVVAGLIAIDGRIFII